MEEGDPQILWSNRIDGRFHVRVVRVDGDTGRFTIVDSLDPAAGGLGTLASDDVPLLYQAAYGPDSDDVAAWMDRSIQIVDSALGLPGGPPPGGARD